MFGYISFILWPVVTVILLRVFSLQVALVSSIVAGYLLLPPLIVDLPVIPQLDKNTIPALAALCLILIMGSQRNNSHVLPGLLPKGKVAKGLVIITILSPIPTVFSNLEPVYNPGIILPALRPWDAISMLARAALLILPFLLARKYLAHPKDQFLLLVSIAVAGALFSFLALYEVRMSPQLNRMIYGFQAHDWITSFRGGGFRPVVFFVNGLLLAMFLATAILCAFGVVRATRSARKFTFFWVALWILFTLILAKSLGALVLVALLSPVVLFLSRRGILILAAGLSIVVLFYPMLRGVGAIPVEWVIELSQSVSADRAQSLAYRLQNEDVLLERSGEKPFFGWGGWGRNHLFSDEGRLLTVTDGYWIGLIGTGGWLRYLAEFGLICLPALFALFFYRRCKLEIETALLSIVLAANLVDLLPNASLTAVTWLIAGSIWGRIELGDISQHDETEIGPISTDRKLVYSRYAKADIASTSKQTGVQASSQKPYTRYGRPLRQSDR